MIVTSSEQIPPEGVGVNRWFTGDNPKNLIAGGSFEEFLPGEDFPSGWGQLASQPKVEPETDIAKFGRKSMKLVGTTNKQVLVRSVTALDVEELKGLDIVFGGWIYTPDPKRTAVQIVLPDEKGSWKNRVVARPSALNAWELVTATATVPDDCQVVHCAFTLVSDKRAVCLLCRRCGTRGCWGQRSRLRLGQSGKPLRLLMRARCLRITNL